MNPIAAYHSSQYSNPRSTSLMKAAEQELSAFFNAVLQLFGKEQAELSAEDWLHELTEANGLPSSNRNWRSITARVSTRLATRVSVSPLPTECTNA
jgi:hypothetical protein